MKLIITAMRSVLLTLFCTRLIAGDCSAMRTAKLKNATVESADRVAAGSFTPPGSPAINNLPAFCRVAITAKPSKDSDIRIELWLPEQTWNGRFEGTGNGGFAGKISYGALAGGVKQGYAVANTDMGMAAPDVTAFVDRPERWRDWGYRATHEMTVTAKELVRAYYNGAPKRSYFTGCSTGGQQALSEAQRFPDDYDGIVSGAPAHNRTGVHMSILWNFAAVERDPESYLPPDKVQLLTQAVVKACAVNGVIEDPRTCHFDPATVQGLTPKQVEAVRKIYAGPEGVYPGVMPGSEFSWDRLGGPPSPSQQPPYAPIFRWVFGRNWDWRTFDFTRDPKIMERKLAHDLNATDPDLDRFRKHNGKLLLYHGWADWLVPPGETVRYFDAVRERDTRHHIPTDDSARLFLLPGVSHCSGGPGPDQIDPLKAVVQWVEEGKAPATLTARKVVEGKTVRTEALCPYPTKGCRGE